MKRDQIIIFILVGALTFSAVASGLLFLADDSPSTADTAENDTTATDNQTGEENPLMAGCTSSDEALSNTGSPMGDWPATIADPLGDLEVTDLREGTGPELKLGDCISVHYRLSLADGTPVSGNNTFEDLGQPIAFELAVGGLIDGWTEGLPGMKEGGYRRLLVPAAKAYGESARPGIPANSDLIFDVELVKIET